MSKLKYLAGAYSIADMASYSWVRSATKYQALDEFPHLAAWFERRGRKRPAVQRGMALGKEVRKPMTDDEKKHLFGQRARSAHSSPARLRAAISAIHFGLCASR